MSSSDTPHDPRPDKPKSARAHRIAQLSARLRPGTEPDGSPTGWRAHWPRLDREGRKELLERVSAGAHPDIDFCMMMVLSVGLASLGLLQGSTAVVIGAMLVAPLMGPLVGAGLALTQANAKLFRTSLATVCVGLTIGFGISLLIGLANPGYEPSMEIEARGRPDILDLGIAFLAGMTAGWALGRPNVAGTLAGVAIAAALVPPLAVVGIALTHNELLIANNAFILVTTNVVAITLGAALSFRLLGTHHALADAKAPFWARLMNRLLMLATLLLVMPLMAGVTDREREGEARPLTFPVAQKTRDAVRGYLEDWPQHRLVALARGSVEPHGLITVIIESAAPATAEFDRDLKHVIRTARGAEVPVEVFSLRAGWSSEQTGWESQDSDSPNQLLDR